MLIFRYLLLLIRNFGKPVKIGLLANVLSGSIFEGNNSIGRFTTFKGSIGRCSYIGSGSVIFGKIGRYVSIASGVHVLNGRHPMGAPYVSTNPMFYASHSILGSGYVKDDKFIQFLYAESNYPVVIGNDCWIGTDVKIVDGIRIADGVIALAGAVITKDVPPYAIVGGVPAKVIGFRYTNEQINELCKIQWWNKDEVWIQKHASEFLDIDKFIERNRQ